MTNRSLNTVPPTRAKSPQRSPDSAVSHWLGGGQATRNLTAVLLAWIILIFVTTLKRPDFLSHDTVIAVTFTMTITGVLAIGLALVTMSGGFLDLSIPVSLILPALVTVQLTNRDVPLGIVVILALFSGAAWGAINGAIVVLGRLNPLIVTLGTNLAAIGLLSALFNQQQISQQSVLRSLGDTQILGLPGGWWIMVLLLVLTGVLLSRTRAGRHLVATGGNSTAASQRGISVPRVRFTVFVLSGICGGIAGLLFVAQNGVVQPTDGNSFLLPVVSAVILAGISFTGGRGNVLALLISGGFLATVPTSLAFFGLSSAWQDVLQGVILIVAVCADGWRRKKARAR